MRDKLPIATVINYKRSIGDSCLGRPCILNARVWCTVKF